MIYVFIFQVQTFYAKDVSTHPSMVSTHQHRLKEKLCKNVKSVSTHVKSVSTRVAVFQRSRVPRSTHSQGRLTLDPVPRTASLRNWEQVDTLKSRSTRDLSPRTDSSIFGTVCRHNHQGRSTHYGNFSS